jgi:hypothetical protein
MAVQQHRQVLAVSRSVGDLLLQLLDALEQEAEEKGGVQQVLADHFAKVYTLSIPLAAW